MYINTLKLECFEILLLHILFDIYIYNIYYILCQLGPVLTGTAVK